MNKTIMNCLITGVILLGLPLTVAQAAQCKQAKLLNAPAVNNHPVIYRYARPIRFHTAYYCPDNAMYYPQTLGCMGSWVVVQR